MTEEQFKELPGAELLINGLHDLRSGKQTLFGYLVLSAATRLRFYGIDVPHIEQSSTPAAHDFYRLLSEQHGSNAYSLYNSYGRRLVSLMRALGST